MTFKKIRGVPWNGRIDNVSQFDDGNFPGWNPGQIVFPETAYGRPTWTGSKQLDNIDWYQTTTAGTVDFSANKLFKDGAVAPDGAVSTMSNATNHNTLAGCGAYTSNANFWDNNDFTFPSDARGSMVRNAIGFACKTTIAGSFSDDGGDAQAKIAKVGMVYADPSNFERKIFLADTQMFGNKTLGAKYDDTNEYWYSYRISNSSVTDVHDDKLVLMGMIFQMFHGSKASNHTSSIRAANMRIIVGDSVTGLVGPSVSSSIMLLKDPETTTIDDNKNGVSSSYTY